MLFKTNIKTDKQTQLIDITSEIKSYIKKSNVRSGICALFVPHTTAGITINENADPSVQQDILYEINKVIPFNDNYKHMEGNSAAHIKTSLFKNSEHIIIENNQLVLGTWQGIYFSEFDGPRNRKLYIKIISD
jgi:secondary thiamine-phosphate synthase enzyme